MKICKHKNFFVIKVSSPWQWHETFDKILHYKLFSFSPFSTSNQRNGLSNSVKESKQVNVDYWSNL